MDAQTSAAAVATDYINAYFTHIAHRSTRGQLASLYRSTSTVTYGDIQLTGVDEIIPFLHNLPFDEMTFTISELKVCPSGGDGGGVLVLVIGESRTEEFGRQDQVIEAFHLERLDGGDFYIAGQILTMLDPSAGGESVGESSAAVAREEG